MTTFLFWNVRGQVLGPVLAQLAAERDVDIFILAEPSDNKAAVLTALNGGASTYRSHDSRCPRIDLVSRLPNQSLRPLHDDDVLSIWRLAPPLCKPTTLACVHFWSKLYLSDYDQFALSARIREAIDDVETQEAHGRTILVGDLNMDPFSHALVNSEGVHSVMCQGVASRDARVVKGRTRRMFFNPMWSLLGDHPSGPPGTYYKDLSGEPTNFFWHTFDQVLFRQDLLGRVDLTRVQILTKAGKDSLVTLTGIPDKEKYSDHLPIIFDVDLAETYQ